MITLYHRYRMNGAGRAWGRSVCCVLGAVAGAMVMLGGGLAGCDSAPKDLREVGNASKAPLLYAQVAEAYNARLVGADRLTSQVSVIIETDGRDESGQSRGRTRDQLEGNLSVARPQRIALRLDKVGQNVAYLGSDERSYWWFDMAGKEPTAIVGTHANAIPQDAADFGLPVHPLEFIELLGVLPLPPAAVQGTKAATVRWSKDGRFVEVTAPSRWGSRRLTLDPVTYEPSRIELVDGQGQMAASSLLSRFAPASIEGKPGESVAIATRVEMSIPANTTKVTMVLADPRVPLKIRPRAFDVAALVEAYSIKNFIDHDLVKSRRGSLREQQIQAQLEELQAERARLLEEQASLKAGTTRPATPPVPTVTPAKAPPGPLSPAQKPVTQPSPASTGPTGPTLPTVPATKPPLPVQPTPPANAAPRVSLDLLQDNATFFAAAVIAPSCGQMC